MATLKIRRPGQRDNIGAIVNAYNENFSSVELFLKKLPVAESSIEVFTTLNVGETKQLSVTATPTDATLSYVSGDSAIATVSSEGLVTTVAEGTVSITVTGVKDNYTDGTLTITFIIIPATQVKIESTTATTESAVFTVLNVGETKQLAVTTTPADATLSYVSGDTDIATVSGGGLVTAVAEGQVNITITGIKIGLNDGTAVVVFKVIAADMVKVETATGIGNDIIEVGIADFNVSGVEFVLVNGYVDMPVPSVCIVGGDNKYPAVTFIQETVSGTLCYSKITVVPETGSTGTHITLSAVCSGEVVAKV